ncbi:MAG: hypothetical protein EOO04_36515 [Chitinophagaceae bacterium]|nr:MAG: hypothetical protein EOO04_36515 [Chitinophagaceae bacterium]
MGPTKNSLFHNDPFTRANDRHSVLKLRQEERRAEIEREKSNIISRVCSIIMDCLNAERLTIKDTLSYLSFQLDESPKKTICRFYFGKRTYIAFIREDRSLEKIIIDDMSQIDNYAERITLTTKKLAEA